MGRRERRRGRLRAPEVPYADAYGNALVLRGSIRAGARASYATIASGAALRPGETREDAWHRAVEFLFEQLAVSWEIAGTEPLKRQEELLARFRVATAAERGWVRETLRAHCAEHFPDIAPP